MEPGPYPGMDRATYETIVAANYSTLKLFERSEAHAKEQMDHPRSSTPAPRFGQAVHCGGLEPAVFAEEWTGPPINPKTKKAWDRRTKEGKIHWAALEEQYGENVLNAKDWDAGHAMKDALYAHPIAREILTGEGVNEVTLVWDDPVTGQRCKGMIDRLTTFQGHPAIVDLKTTEDASPEGFSRQVARYNYHVQNAYYCWGAQTIVPLDTKRRFLWIAIEKAPPYAITVQELGETGVEEGDKLWREWLNRYATAMQKNHWPAYPEAVVQASLPTWAYTWEEDEG